MAAKRAVRYAVIDAFTGAPFKGNPAAVCFLEDGEEADETWMRSIAAEFNLSETAFITPVAAAAPSGSDNPRFNLRWFTPVDEVDLCGHATLAAAYFLLTCIVKCNEIEFMTKSGLLLAKKYHGPKKCSSSKLSYDEAEGSFSIELDFPVVPFVECDASEIPSLPATLKGASVTSVQKTATDGDLIVELASGKDILDLKPVFDELLHCSKRGVIITGPAPLGSGFDFLTRFFCPILGIDEDPVTGSIHCALAPYWSKKLGKHSLVAYQASPRGGRLDLQWEEQNQRVLIRGEAVTVMTGTVLV